MRIQLNVCIFAGGLRAMAPFLLTSKEPHLFGFINSIVDTGSPTTIIGASDLKKMRISKIQLNKLIGPIKPIHYGGAEVETRILEKATLKIGGQDFKLSVHIPIKDAGNSPPPTILGVDFLTENKLKFVFNPTKQEAYFESSE